jgi:ketosteroid isomerase-like protein
MSRQNEQVARRAYDAFSSGDFEALAALLHPEVEFESLLLEMEAGSYRGLEGAREYFESVREVFPDWSLEITRLDDFGDRVVIRAARWRPEGAAAFAPSASGRWPLFATGGSSGGSSSAVEMRPSKPSGWTRDLSPE